MGKTVLKKNLHARRRGGGISVATLLVFPRHQSAILAENFSNFCSNRTDVRVRDSGDGLLT